jgi:DNA-binding transcriptional regulator YhcF (GntR family)
MSFWTEIETEIFKNSQLDIYEKMCLLVLMSQGEEVRLSSDELAMYMGCGVNTAKRAFESLRIKGFIEKDYAASPPVRRESNVLRNESVGEILKPIDEFSGDFKAGFYTTSESEGGSREHAEPPKDDSGQDDAFERRKQMAAYLLGDDSVLQKPFVSKKVTTESLTDQVIALIDEKISSKEANIILAFANNDVDKIKKKYQIAKQSQVSDTIGVLINELQKKDSNVIKTDDPLPENTQVDTNRLLKMQAYQNSRYNK